MVSLLQGLPQFNNCSIVGCWQVVVSVKWPGTLTVHLSSQVHKLNVSGSGLSGKPFFLGGGGGVQWTNISGG